MISKMLRMLGLTQTSCRSVCGRVEDKDKDSEGLETGWSPERATKQQTATYSLFSKENLVSNLVF